MDRHRQILEERSKEESKKFLPPAMNQANRTDRPQPPPWLGDTEDDAPRWAHLRVSAQQIEEEFENFNETTELELKIGHLSRQFIMDGLNDYLQIRIDIRSGRNMKMLLLHQHIQLEDEWTPMDPPVQIPITHFPKFLSQIEKMNLYRLNPYVEDLRNEATIVYEHQWYDLVEKIRFTIFLRHGPYGKERMVTISSTINKEETTISFPWIHTPRFFQQLNRLWIDQTQYSQTTIM